uniref:Radical SAM protein n=1 Tax=candidate division CPR3 bacterium TaxID=2268181 RepID=A0A7V3N5G3_UNCC3
MKKLAKFLRAPIFVWWDITKRCNFRCKHCYSNSGEKAIGELPLPKVIEVINQLAELEVFYIYFLGGEPLMREDIFEILSYCLDKGLTTMMSTNGWFVNPAVGKKLKATGINHVRVSLDGTTPEIHDSIRGVPGSFNRALTALEILKDVGIPRVGISPTLLPDNLHQIGEIIDLAVRNKVDEIQVVQLCATGRGANIPKLSKEQLEYAQKEIEDRILKYKSMINVAATEGILEKRCSFCIKKEEAIPSIMGCIGGRSCAAIDAEGRVSPCIMYRREAGNLMSEPFSVIWKNSPLFLEMRRIKDSCVGCAFSKVCVGECPLDRKITDQERAGFATSIKISSAQSSGCYKIGSIDCFLKV